MAVFNESSIRDGDFEGARMTLEKLENPKLFSRDIYYLWQWEGTMRRRTVYLMYMTDNYRNMGVEEIKKEEEAITRRQMEKVLATGANVVVCGHAIDDLCLKYLVEAGAIGVRRVGNDDLIRVSKATQATIVVVGVVRAAQ